MKHQIRATLVLLAALLGGNTALAQSAEAPAVVPAADSTRAAIALDGRLDEDLWKSATLIAELVQQSPRPGEPTPFRTVVRVLVVGNTLYFGFECVDPEPGRIAVHDMKRDGEVEGDDTVSVVLDTFGDRRTGYFFRINAAGARMDGLISNPEHPSLDWDGLWDARTSRSPAGWSAELEIPAATLNFTPGLKAWGVNLERFIARDRVTLRWKSPTLDSFLYDLSRAGELPGVEHLAQGHGLEFTPYLSGRNRVVFGETQRIGEGDAGGELTWRITPGLQSVATFNTDFAETEVDSRQINITRFPLFFPEKRAFFLEGSNQFGFGLGLGQQFIPFFSRRIGLLGGQQIPIDAGLKLNGRAGNWNIGLLDVQTRDVAAAPSTNLFAGRVSYDVTKALRVGAIVTNGDPHGLRTNTLTGADAVWQTSKFLGDKNFMVGAWSALSTGDLQPGRQAGWGFKIDYPNDLWDCTTGVNVFGDALDPALGFLPRPGTRQYSVGCDWMPRPSKRGPLRFIRQEFFENRYSRTTNLNGINESWRYFMAPINVRFESGDRFEFNWAPQYEFLQEPFEIVEGVNVPPGAYNFTRWRLEAETSPHRPISFGSTTWFGSFYGGHLTQWENELNWTSTEGRIQLGLAVEQNFGRLPEGSFVQRLWQLQAAAAMNPNLVLTSFIQYDSESRNFGANTRLRWTIRPGRELFVIWNRGWRRLITSRDELKLVPDEELIAVKLKWTFRI